MKKKLIMISMLLSISLPIFASTKIAVIKERSSSRSLIYSIDGDQLIFKLLNEGKEEEIKRLSLSNDSQSVQLRGDQNIYQFEIFKSMKEASKKSYDWCWKPNPKMPYDMPTVAGVAIMSLGTALVPMAALCASLPGTPYILGLLLAPIDGIISLGDRLFDKDAIAARKFKSLLKAKNKKASKKVFNSLIEQLKKL